jgi:hypothetical protein
MVPGGEPRGPSHPAQDCKSHPPGGERSATNSTRTREAVLLHLGQQGMFPSPPECDRSRFHIAVVGTESATSPCQYGQPRVAVATFSDRAAPETTANLFNHRGTTGRSTGRRALLESSAPRALNLRAAPKPVRSDAVRYGRSFAAPATRTRDDPTGSRDPADGGLRGRHGGDRGAG